MRALWLVVGYWLVVNGTCKADNVTLVNGTTLSDVSVTKVEPTQITVMTGTGIQKIPMDKLSPDLQAKYNYSPEKAAAYQKDQEKKASAAQAKIATDLKQQNDQQTKTTELNTKLKDAKPTTIIAKIDTIKGSTFTSYSQYWEKATGYGLASVGGGGPVVVHLEPLPNSKEIIVTEAADLANKASGEKWSGQVWDVGVLPVEDRQIRHYTADLDAYIKSQSK